MDKTGTFLVGLAAGVAAIAALSFYITENFTINDSSESSSDEDDQNTTSENIAADE